MTFLFNDRIETFYIYAWWVMDRCSYACRTLCGSALTWKSLNLITFNTSPLLPTLSISKDRPWCRPRCNGWTVGNYLMRMLNLSEQSAIHTVKIFQLVSLSCTVSNFSSNPRMITFILTRFTSLACLCVSPVLLLYIKQLFLSVDLIPHIKR